MKNYWSLTICFTPKNILIGSVTRNKMRQFPESSIFKSKRFLGDQYSNPNVHKDIERWLIKIIEDPKTKKPKYVIKVKDKISEYFPEKASTMILEYLKKQQI